jgi:hypothetical protein
MDRREYTPSEQLEAQDKRDQRKEGAKEAIFYRRLLEGVHNKVIRKLADPAKEKIYGKFDFDTEFLLKDVLPQGFLKECFESSLKEAQESSLKEAQDDTGQNINPQVNIGSLEAMNPKAFIQYIEKQQDSLIKG